MNFQPKNGCGTYDWVPSRWMTDPNIRGFIFNDMIIFVNTTTLLHLENGSIFSGRFSY